MLNNGQKEIQKKRSKLKDKAHNDGNNKLRKSQKIQKCAVRMPTNEHGHGATVGQVSSVHNFRIVIIVSGESKKKIRN